MMHRRHSSHVRNTSMFKHIITTALALGALTVPVAFNANAEHANIHGTPPKSLMVHHKVAKTVHTHKPVHILKASAKQAKVHGAPPSLTISYKKAMKAHAHRT